MTLPHIAANSHDVDERYDSDLTSFSHVPPYLTCFLKVKDKIKDNEKLQYKLLKRRKTRSC